MLIRFADGRTTFLDFRERAPKQATRNMYLDAAGKPTRDSLEGWRASGVPGSVRGFEMAHKKYGHAKWQSLVEPAVMLASRGFTVSYSLAESLKNSKLLAKFEKSKSVFQRSGNFYEMGDTFAQPELARTLERIAKQGRERFLRGRNR
jgi:gamma-glutamyltranspeptidase/glutathione hydrolase